MVPRDEEPTETMFRLRLTRHSDLGIETITNDLSNPMVLGGHKYVYSDEFNEGVTTELEALAFWKVRGYCPQDVSEFFGP